MAFNSFDVKIKAVVLVFCPVTPISSFSVTNAAFPYRPLSK
jgi:hypothetical protein